MKKLLMLSTLLFCVSIGAQNNQVNHYNQKQHMKRITFKSQGLNIIGNLYFPTQYKKGEHYPALIISGSWTTVKEQMAGLYAEKLAEKGFITLAFDFRNYGESEGKPRFWENPRMKIEDISAAVNFLVQLPEVNKESIGAFGVCAGAMYTLIAATKDNRIKSVVTAASWLQDEEAVKLFYGGETGVKAKIEAARKAKDKFIKTGIVEYIETISTSNPSAAMYGSYDYYLNPERGAVKEWSNDKFAIMSWEEWLTLNPMPYANKLKVPTLMIHSDACVLPQYTKRFFKKIASKDKRLDWIATTLESPMQQFKFYDQKKEVELTVTKAAEWFHKKL